MGKILTTLFLAAVAMYTLPGGLRIWIVIGTSLVCLLLGATLSKARPLSGEFIGVAALPVILGLVAMFAGYRDVNRNLTYSALAGRSAYETGRQQARLAAYVGAGTTLVILAATVIRRRRRNGEEPTLNLRA